MKKLLLLSFLLLLLTGCGCRNTSKQEQKQSPYGDWEICEYVNDFDEPTGEKYVRQIVQGDFSNSATASSPLRVYVFLHHYFNDYSKKHSVEGKIIFDEYADGTEDYHIWSDASPAKTGSKIIDKPNRKAYYYEERRAFRDIDTDRWYYWIDVLRDTSSVFDFTIKGDYRDEYRFSINSDKLNEALIDAGFFPDGVE